MNVRGNRSVVLTILAFAVFAVLIVALVVLARRIENHLGTIETQMLDRAPTAPPLQELAASPVVAAAGETVYVPVYSHIYASRGSKLRLEVTLSIRNTDLDLPIVIKSLRYYDTAGRMLREYLEAPVLLEPMASTDFLVERRDVAGGVGANFLVDWVAEDLVSEPIIEAVMVSHEGTKAFSFVRSGRPIATLQAGQ